MKKLFVAVIMFVIVPSVLAQGPMLVPTPTSPPEDGTPTHNQTQGGQQHPTETPPPDKTPTNNSLPYKTSTEDGEGKKNPPTDDDDWRPPWVAILSLIVSAASFWVARRSLLMTDQARRITERAYLSAEQWETKGEYLVCKITNKGRTPATLLKGLTEFTLLTDPSATEHEAQRRVDRNFGEAELSAQVTVSMQVGALTPAEVSAVKNDRSLILRVEAYIEYRDAFKEVRNMRFVMEYDGRINDFVIADKRSATKSRKQQNSQ